MAKAAEAGISISANDQIANAVESGYSAVLWWAVGLTLLASVLAGLLITARAPRE